MIRTNLHIFLSPIRNESRLLKEAKALIELDIFRKVVVVGYWESGLPEKECIGGFLDVIRVKTTSRSGRDRVSGGRTPWSRRLIAIVSLIQYFSATYRECRFYRPTHISCHNLLLLPVGWILSFVSASRLIYLPHELETERAGLRGVLKKLSVHIEKLFIRKYSQVVVVCEPIADWYRSRYGLTNVNVIRSIPDISHFDISMEDRKAGREAMGLPQDERVYIYQGILDRRRGVDKLIEIFEGPASAFGHLILMGYGEAVSDVQMAAKRCRNIHYKSAVPVSLIIHHSALADVGIFCVDDPLPLSYQYALPNKFFEYLNAGLPVIVSPNLLLLAKLVQSDNLGWVVTVAELPSLLASLTDGDIATRRPFIARFNQLNTWDKERGLYRSVYV